MRVPGHDWLYAVGDVNGRSLLTHAAKYQARVAAATIMNRDLRAFGDGPTAPRVVFTEPQVAAVGHTLDRRPGRRPPGRTPWTPRSGARPGRASSARGLRPAPGSSIDRERDVIIGATFTGPQVADWLHAATIAIAGEVPAASG